MENILINKSCSEITLEATSSFFKLFIWFKWWILLFPVNQFGVSLCKHKSPFKFGPFFLLLSFSGHHLLHRRKYSLLRPFAFLFRSSIWNTSRLSVKAEQTLEQLCFCSNVLEAKYLALVTCLVLENSLYNANSNWFAHLALLHKTVRMNEQNLGKTLATW